MRRALLVLFLMLTAMTSLEAQRKLDVPKDARPMTRWWWFASVIDSANVNRQLGWLAANGFGGVEIAWVYPTGGDTAAARLPWLSPALSVAVAQAKRSADRLGLRCDFTFGTLWPFGDSKVPPSDASVFFRDSSTTPAMRLTWEHPVRGRVVNHLDHAALERYAARMGAALAPALAAGRVSSLFCDSWEVETKRLWTRGFGEAFRKRFGYALEPLMDSVYRPGFEGVFYDYMALLSDKVLHEFYSPFTGIAHRLGATSRAQCGGAPADLLTAFSLVDIPETEAILYEPGFSRIPASAAALASKPVVTAEAFTCAYGWKRWPGPSPHQKHEQVADLKLIADALFANGCNGIIWHGMPYQRADTPAQFYASVHVGPDAAFAKELPAFNHYMETVAAQMRRGRSASDVAVWLPTEDAWMSVEYPDSLKFPWVWGQYELRYLRPPDELKGRQPLWINAHFLSNATLNNGRLVFGDASFSALYIDVRYLAIDALRSILSFAKRGFPICLKRDPAEPGRTRTAAYGALLAALKAQRSVHADWTKVATTSPLVEGSDLPDFWCREEKDTLVFFFADPRSRGVKYPLRYGQGLETDTLVRNIRITCGDVPREVTLRFAPNQSLLLDATKDGRVRFTDIRFVPSPPARDAGG